jgi:1-pyrroline-5-carboxylate dehydrogenase
MAVFREAGLPDGVINLIYGEPAAITEIVLADEALAGVHFTGSTAVFGAILGETAKRRYRNYPRIVGETGGKNFTLTHPSADPAALATAIIRGGYEYQGQKCSATSRVYVPRSLWPEVRDALVDAVDRGGDALVPCTPHVTSLPLGLPDPWSDCPLAAEHLTVVSILHKNQARSPASGGG